MDQIRDSKPLSQRAFARLIGVSHTEIARGVKGGRLSRSVKNGKIIDAELAKLEWVVNADTQRAKPEDIARLDALAASINARLDAPLIRDPAEVSSEAITMSGARLRETLAKAQLAELKFKEASEDLIPRAEVVREGRNDYAIVRTRLLGIPTRARQALPHLTISDLAVLEDLIREALQVLSEAKDV